MFLKRLIATLVVTSICFSGTLAQNVPTPKEHFGFYIGDNYQLANFTQTEAYFKKLAQASDRAKYTVIGKQKKVEISSCSS